MDEAARCLGCKKPMCQKGCPINTPIPEVIKLLKEQHPKMNDSAVQFYDEEVKTDKPIFNYDGSIRF